MATEKIEFGTDGFRGIIARDFTFHNVERITDALCAYLQGTNEGKTVIVGYDPRFMADDFAKFSSKILEKSGFKVILSSKVVPTPIVAYAAKTTQDSTGALMFTASHNPKEYLGIKFIPNYGGPATKEITDKLVELIEKDAKGCETAGGGIAEKDLSGDYLKHLETLIDIDSIKNANIKFIYDGLYSASIGYFDTILKTHNIDFEMVNGHYDPNFGGGMPEPKPKYMKHTKAGYVTFANDGDADRYGVIDENGNYISPNVVIAMLLKFLKEVGKSGMMVKTVGVSQLVDVVAKKLNVETITTAVGFKWIAEAMRKNDTMLGGEDSGGLSIGAHIPEKDGIFANLLILEMMAKSGKTLSQLVEDIYEFAGAKFLTDRVDMKLQNAAQKEELKAKFVDIVDFGGLKVKETIKIDGVKFLFDDDLSWLLIRESGTEPLLRFYIESDDANKIEKIKEFIKITAGG